MAQRGYRTIKLELPRSREIADVCTSARVADALVEITSDATLYDGVRLVQVMEAVYLQGRKDGAREAFDRIDLSLTTVKDEIPHRRPGRPQLTGARKTGARKTGARKTGARKTGARKTGARKTGARKTGARKTGARKTGARKKRAT